MPRVSVIVPTFNRAGLLREALASVQAQSSPDWECVVVDDGSTDETPAVAASLSAADPRIHSLRIEHGGSPGRSRNVGIRNSRAEFVAFLDDDDLWLPRKLDRQISLLSKIPDAGMVFSQVERFGDAEGPWPRTLPEHPGLRQLLASNVIACSTVVARRSVLELAGLFDESLPRAQDLDLWLSVVRLQPIRGQSEILARYRVDSARLARQLPVELEALERIFGKLRGEVPARYFRPGRRRIHRARARAAGTLRQSLAEWWRTITV